MMGIAANHPPNLPLVHVHAPAFLYTSFIWLIMSTMSDDILFHNVTEEELAVASAVGSPMTNDEFNAFILSLSSPNDAEFGIFDNSLQDLPPEIYSLLSQPMQDSGFAQKTLADLGFDQPFLDSASAMPPPATPSEFVIECGMDPSEFKSLEQPTEAGDADVWNCVMHEILDKMTEWAKSTNVSLMKMGVSTQDMQKFGLLDDALLPMTMA